MKKYYQKIKSVLGLSVQLAIAEFKLRNEGSYLGIFWYLLNPLLVFALLFLVFSDRLGSGIAQYALYLLFGIIIFNFFQSTTIESVSSMIKENKFIIKSINFSRESLILGIVIKNLFSHFFEVAFFMVMLIFFKISLIGMIYYFFVLFFLCLFTFGVSLLLSSLTVYFSDLESVWIFAVRLLWLGTPIFYAIAGQIRLYYINLFNPMYYFITVARDLIIYGINPGAAMIYGMIFYSVLLFLTGMLIFNKLKVKFAEKI